MRKTMCDFCENGKRVKAEYKGEGNTTCQNMIDIIFGGFSEDAFEVAHIENDEMWVDNSSGEYAELGFKISYCPFCGADMRPISALSENVEIVSNLKRGES